MHQGLTSNEITESRHKHGSNAFSSSDESSFLKIIRGIVFEPMFIFLLSASFIYFFAARIQEGLIMIISIFIVAGISIYQDYRSRNAISALKKLSASKASVRREGVILQIPVNEVVVDDIVLLKEGEIVAADGIILSSNDFSLNESILTGESFTVDKSAQGNSLVYKGTLVTGGSAEIKVSAVGDSTTFGKIGISLQEIKIIKTPLQKQIASFVRNMVWIGAVAFFIVVGFNYYSSGDFIHSFLQGLTLAMSILPEEIPVAFSTFQALGAFRLLKNNIIVKQPQYVETLGSATVICADKTGTLTQNKMSIEQIYDVSKKISFDIVKT
ncbi:MAG: HAD-IC family P-type ATPase, partial [Ferruginibacter sp.]|nr:HAD-IC family P-type ATPase [Ferruginibacter sp.]